MFLLVVLSVYMLGIMVILIKNPALQDNLRWNHAVIIADTTLFTLAYILTKEPKSDLFLLYFLPLITAGARLKGWRERSWNFGLVFLFFLAVVIAVNVWLGTSVVEAFLRDYIPRALFFFLIFFLTVRKIDDLELQKSELDAVRCAILNVGDENLSNRLNSVLSAAVELVRGQGGVIYLKNHDAGVEEDLPMGSPSAADVLLAVAYDDPRESRPLVDPRLPAGSDLFTEVYLLGKSLFHRYYSDSSASAQPWLPDPCSIIAAPLSIDHQQLGVIEIFSSLPDRTFTQDDLKVLEYYCPHAAITVQDILLVGDVRKQSEALSILNDAGKEMNLHMQSSDALLSCAAKYAAQLVNVYNEKEPLFTEIGLLQPDRSLKFTHHFPPVPSKKVKPGSDVIDLNAKPFGIVGRSIDTGQTIRVTDVTKDADYIKLFPKTKSQLVVPIKAGGEALGVINIEHEEQGAFPDRLQKNLEVLAAQTATSLNNARNVESIAQQRDRADKLYKASVALVKKTNIVEVGNEILEQLKKLVEYDRATLQCVDKEEERKTIARRKTFSSAEDAYLNRPVSEDKLIQWVVKLKKVQVLQGPDFHPHWEINDSTRDVKTWICLPFVFAGKVIGLVMLDLLNQKTYTDEEKDLLGLFTNFAAGVLQSTLLLEENSASIAELNQQSEYLRTMVDYFQDYYNLAMIGLVFGESIHHARNNLGYALTKIADIERGYYDPDQTKTQLNKAREAINDYMKTLDETRSMAIQQPPLVPLDLRQVINNVVSMKKISRYIPLEWQINEKIPMIKAPKQQLEQVFHVIINNALDAMSSGEGKLTISLRTEKRKEPQTVIAVISDTGPGIPKSKQDTLFSLKEKSRRGGSGIGLAWARSFLRSFEGGDITHVPVEGEGTTIYVYIPVNFQQKNVLSPPVKEVRSLGKPLK